MGYVAFIIALSAISTFLLSRTTTEPSKTILGAFLSFSFGLLIQRIWDERKRMLWRLQFSWLIVTRKSLRISFATLVRITVGDEYLLVKSRRTSNWQPVGGVIKYYDQAFIDRVGLRDDRHLQKKVENEMRKEFPVGKVFGAIALIDWFDSRKDREVSPGREFCEELLDTGILSDSFRAAEFRFIERYFVYSFSEAFQVQELKAFEVFELMPTTAQSSELLSLQKSGNVNIKFLTRETIERRGHVREGEDVPLGDHTRFIV